jgi:heme exporter protein C
MRIAELANPSRFLRIADLAIAWLIGPAILLFAFAIARVALAPNDYQQGATVKIMFLHVPSAWLGMLCWGLMTIAALGTLVWRHPLADVTAKAAAPLGAAFTLLCLVTGSLWGRPEWGTYWVWDARLTSELILFLLYLAVLALWRTVEDPSRAARAVAILTIVGAVDLPIIKFSVDWWNTLHQGASVFRLGGSTIHPDAAVADGGGVHAVVRDAAAGCHAQRDFAPASTDAASAAGERGRLSMEAMAHIPFIVAAYAAGIIVVGALIAWVILDYRMQRRILAELETKGISRRSARERGERTVSEDA